MDLIPASSVDMVRISFKAKDPLHVMSLIQKFWDDNLTRMDLKHWQSTRYSDYHFTWTVPVGESVLTILFDHNMQQGKSGSRSGCFEWNPNKVDLKSDREVFNLVRSVLSHGLNFELVRADVAHDFKNISIHQCVIDKSSKSSSRYFMGSGNSMTVYAGAQASGGSVKLYDKGREVWETLHIDIGRLVRFEVTYKCNFAFYKLPRTAMQLMGGIRPVTVPELVVMSDLGLEIDIDPEFLLIAEGLCHLPHLYGLLSKYKRKKIKEMKCVSTFSPSISLDELLLRNWFQAFYNDIVA